MWKIILKSEQDIEDAIQNTILTSFNKLKSLREDKYFKTWLIRILINECNKIYNYNKRNVIEIVEEFYTVDKAENMDLYDAISKLSEELKVTTILYYFEDLIYKEIANVKKYDLGIFIESSINTSSLENNLGYILWDSKKGELGMVVGYPIEDGLVSYQYRLPSEDGELYIIPYINSSYGKFDPEEDRIEEHLVEAGKSYNFGDYGTIEIKDIVHEDNETLMKVRSTGAQSRVHFNLINGKKGGYFRPAYEKDKTILGILDMEVTYVFNKLDQSENYYIEVPIDDEKIDFKILTDDIIKLELN